MIGLPQTKEHMALQNSKIITTLGNPILREASKELQVITPEVLKVISQMKFALKLSKGHAIAANQIGKNLPIFVYEVGKSFQAIINPKLSDFSDEMWSFNEGCLSIPGHFFEVQRPKSVKLTGINEKGDLLELTASDLLARIFQHEVDHLHGKLVIDQLDKDSLEEFNRTWKQKGTKNAR